MKVILDKPQLNISLLRLAHQLLENIDDLAQVVFIGLQPRGIFVSNKIVEIIKQLSPKQKIQYGILDITFYRDDVRDELHTAIKTDIPFTIEGKKVILMSTSTGGTLSLKLAANFPEIAGLILYSPNIEINNPSAFLLNDPWGLQIRTMLFGFQL